MQYIFVPNFAEFPFCFSFVFHNFPPKCKKSPPKGGLCSRTGRSLLQRSLDTLWLRSKARAVSEQAPRSERWSKVILTAFVVTWCNPQALIDGTLMLGAVRASLPAGQAPLFVMGTASASCLWFLA